MTQCILVYSYRLWEHQASQKLRQFYTNLHNVTGRRGRRCKQVFHDLKEKRRYWNLKEDALDFPMGKLDLEGSMDSS
jgi:hypothetical protein